MIDRLDLHAFADRELPANEMARTEQELLASPEAMAELDSIVGLKRCLQTKLDAPECAAEWKLCLSRLDELDRVKKAEGFVGKYAWALSAVLFVVILAGGLLNRYRGGTVNIGTAASYSSDILPLDSGPVSQPQVQSWIADQTGHTPAIRLSPFAVVGRGVAETPQGRVLRIQLQDQRGLLNLLVIPNVAGVEGVEPIGGGMYAGQVNGVNCVTWPDSGCAVLLIAPRSPDELRAVAESLYRLGP